MTPNFFACKSFYPRNGVDGSAAISMFSFDDHPIVSISWFVIRHFHSPLREISSQTAIFFSCAATWHFDSQ